MSEAGASPVTVHRVFAEPSDNATYLPLPPVDAALRRRQILDQLQGAPMAESESTHVRVKDRDGSGAHYTIHRDLLAAFPDNYTVLKSDPVDANGVPVPPKYPNESLPRPQSGPAAPDGPPADTSKEK